MRRECSCEKWDKYIGAINGPLVLAQIRGGYTIQSDDLEPFSYCPWCGKKLIEVEEQCQK